MYLTSVKAKLYNNSKTNMDEMVWEIISTHNKYIYYEYKNYKGYIGKGIKKINDNIQLAKVVTNKNIIVLKEKDGYIAPKSWYYLDKSFKGKKDIIFNDNSEDHNFDEDYEEVENKKIEDYNYEEFEKNKKDYKKVKIN